ncbi:MAG: hypothetical protein ACI9Y1_000817 [Lentisphaeria bacterium]|jgi:hypothetical protein
MEPVGDLHIDDFCKDTAKILIALYKRFPSKSTIFVEDISGPDEPDEFGLHNPRFEACFAAMLWLKETDYITFNQTIRQEAIEEATLSHRSFSMLSALEIESGNLHDLNFNPDSPRVIRRIDCLKNTLKTGTSEHIKKLTLSYFSLSRKFQ